MMKQFREKLRGINWAAIAFVAMLFSPEIIAFSYIALAKEPAERSEAAYGLPGEHLERHGYLLGKPGHFTPWVAEHLTRASFADRSDRADFTFYSDPDVPEEFRATLWDYHGGEYDRGHMAPARDMTHSAMAMRDCYRLSNMMPQRPELNRGEWKRLEEHVAKIAAEAGAEVWVFTGPAWLPNEEGKIEFEALGSHGVWVPTHCFKAVLVKRGDDLELQAWLVPNVAKPPKFEDCRVSVDEVEAAVGLDFFSGLPDEVEAKLEAAK